MSAPDAPERPAATAASERMGGAAVSMAQRLGAILWPSFFAAGVATSVFFAFVDPLALASITFPRLGIGRELGYSLGFFMFWLCTASSSVFTWLLLLPATGINLRGGRG
jgi:hypothetical protein